MCILTPTMKIQFHESHGTVNPIIIRIVIPEFANPREIRLPEVFSEKSKAMLEDGLWVVLIECQEKIDDTLLLHGTEFRDWTSFCILLAIW